MYKRKEITSHNFQKFDKMPFGWKFDTTWGSPLAGYKPINNGKSIFNGGEKGLLKVQENNRKHNITYPQKPKPKPKPKPTIQEHRTYAKKMNDLARLKLKEQLIADLTVDLMICKIEGWDYKEYVKDLKKTINDIFKSIVNNKGASCKRVEQAYKQPDLLGY